MMSKEKDQVAASPEISSAKSGTEERALDVLDEDLLIEEDGDFFWVLQRVVWGILKGIFLLGGIVAIIWFIWRGDDLFDQKETDTVSRDSESSEKRMMENTTNSESSTDTIPNLQDRSVVTENINSLSVIETAYRLNDQQKIEGKGILAVSVQWLKKAKTLGEISPTILRITEPKIRAQKIEAVLLEADSVLSESARIKNILLAQRQQLLQRKSGLESEIKNLDDQLFMKIRRFDSRDIDLVLNQKIKKQQDLVALSEQGKIRETLLKNISGFENLLKQKWIPLIKPVMIQAPVQ